MWSLLLLAVSGYFELADALFVNSACNREQEHTGSICENECENGKGGGTGQAVIVSIGNDEPKHADREGRDRAGE